MATSLQSIPLEEWFAIVESADAPAYIEDEDKWWTETTFKAKDGWKVTFYYDENELDYIHSITTPEGHELDFWCWPETNPIKNALINWRSPGDSKRLLEAIREELKNPGEFRKEDPNYAAPESGQ